MQITTKLLGLSFFALSVTAALGTPTLVTNVTALGTTDTLTWSSLGADGATVPASSTPKTSGNNSVAVALTGSQGLISVVGTSWTVKTGPAMNGDTLLWAYNNSMGVNAGSGPVTLSFSAASGVGAAIQADAPGPFTAVLKLYNGSTLLGTVTETSNSNGDAIFIGATDSTADITSAVFSLSSSGGDNNDFAIDTVYFTQAGKTNVTVNVPTGVSFTLNGAAHTGTQTISLAAGQYTLATTSPQSLAAGTQSVFVSWSDSGAISHSITVGSAPVTITGTFKTQYQLTTAAGTGGTVAPASGNFYDSGTVVPVSATANANYAFSSWTGPVAAPSSASTTVTMSAAASVTATFSLKSSGTPTAVYSGLDTTTKGNWTGNYGADGYIIANDANLPPSYANVNITGDATWTWSSATSDTRALEVLPGATARVASTFYSSASSFNINVDLTDGNAHRIALYLLDWDTTTRSQTISILDAATQQVLDTETFSSFQNGEYASWKVTGSVVIQVTRTGGYNSVVAGIFFDPTGSTPAPTSTATASYVGPDTTSQGSWTQKYGADGDYIANFASNDPSYATLKMTGQNAWTWANPTTDPRALQTSGGQGIASTYYGSSFAFNLNLTDGKAHQVALYLLDWDTTQRAETISILDAATNTVLNSQQFANFHNGEYAVWNITGNVIIQVTGTGGINAVVSGIFFGTASTAPSSSSSASYNGLDATTEGAWSTKYGGDGDFIASNASNSPAYATVSLAGDGLWTWVNPTTDPRALAITSTTGIASTYYGSSLTISVNITDGKAHQVSLYLLDWDTTARSETISILDASTHAVLDTESFSNFHNGVYASWNIKGNVVIQLTQTGGQNAVVSGIFFGPAPTVLPTGNATATYSGLDSTTKGTWTSKYGTSGYLIANDSNNLPAFAPVSLTGDGAWTWVAATSDPRALQIASGSTTRIASTYYSNGGSFNLSLNLTDGKSHKIALYLLDWDSTARAETISIMDSTSHAVLNTQSFSSFQNGEYAVWTITGNVIIQVTDIAGINAVIAGVFVD